MALADQGTRPDRRDEDPTRAGSTALGGALGVTQPQGTRKGMPLPYTEQPAQGVTQPQGTRKGMPLPYTEQPAQPLYGSGAGLSIATITLGALSFIGMMVTIWAAFLYAPTDLIQGDAQRIFYFHVPMAWIAMLAFGVLTVASIVYLWKKDERWDWLARASAELGAVFTTFALVTGTIWGRYSWGTWWVWDPKLTATLVLWFIYIAYIMLRIYMGRTPASARAAAVLGIVGFIDVPIIYEAVNWWRGLHPAAVTTPGALPPAMVVALLIAVFTFTVFYSFLMIQLYNLEKMQTLAQRLRAIVSSERG